MNLPVTSQLYNSLDGIFMEWYPSFTFIRIAAKLPCLYTFLPTWWNFKSVRVTIQSGGSICQTYVQKPGSCMLCRIAQHLKVKSYLEELLIQRASITTRNFLSIASGIKLKSISGEDPTLQICHHLLVNRVPLACDHEEHLHSQGWSSIANLTWCSSRPFH